MGARSFVVIGSASFVTACSLLLGEGFDKESPGDGSGGGGGSDSGTTANDATTPTDAPSANDAGSDGAGGGSCPPGPIDSSLVAWYPFEETSIDTIVDCSGHGRDGKLVAGGSFTRVNGATSTGKGIDLDGVKGCFDLGVSTDLAFGSGSYTVAAWVKPRTYSFPAPDGGTDPKPRSFVSRFEPDQGWDIGTDDPTSVELKAFINASNFSQTQAPISPNAWVHVAGVFTSTKLTLYIGGVAKPAAAANPAGASATAHAWVGCRLDTTTPYDGSLDDVRIYGRALSASEIADLAK